ncbi:MAG: primosomal protein N' [Lachnospiraceae bacterium]|nr:primosomal protein N' [Lachnospiraceae bacterium]
MSQKYADIIIDISHEAIDKTFQYIIPEELIETVCIGMQVEVPFGRYNKTRKGYIIDITDKASFDAEKLKSIAGISDKSIRIEGNLIRLASFIHKTYGSTMINALKTVMPVKEKVRKTEQRITEEEFELKNEPVQCLSDEQIKLIDEFKTDYNNEVRRTYLLSGITGSGKTEVYIGCIKEVIKCGKQAIVLIPEIALTYQNVARFKQHFGNRVAVINSKQSKGERYLEFERVRNREVDVIIGPRSALFAPCDELGLIIIDEEHDMAYKSDQSPKYHAREVAKERARLEHASLILGSATPSVESYSKAKLGHYKLWKLEKRPDGVSLPDISIVDMRDELHLGNRSIISNSLRSAINGCLERKEQIMLFINRRGFNSFVSCRECGEVIKCPKCDVALSLHNNGFMMCHYCGHIERAHKECPKCKSKLIGGFGTGTEKVEEEVKKIFPQAKTLRMDKDTTAKKGAQSSIINQFLNHKADILIGTQMIVKGHDFSNVTLVGILLADISLFSNDYMAGERTFDLLTQAAGRVGRSEKKGNVIIQTYQPEHYAIATAKNQNYDDFFDMEMSYRSLLKYPPVYNMMVMLMTSDNYDSLSEKTKRVEKHLKHICTGDKKIRIIGPADASIVRINDIYRRVIYIKADDLEKLRRIREAFDDYDFDGISLMFDVNPVNTY